MATISEIKQKIQSFAEELEPSAISPSREADILDDLADYLEYLQGYRIAGFVAPDNSYLAKAVEDTCYFATNPESLSWYDNVKGRVYLPPTSWVPAGTPPSSISGWTRVDLSSSEYADFAIMFGFRGGTWLIHRLPYALLTTVQRILSEIANMPYLSAGDATDLDIADDNGNVLVRFSRGHIKTKYFDSSEGGGGGGSGDVEVVNGQKTDLDIADENGNVIVRFADGGILTKNFKSGAHYVHFSFDDTQHCITSLFAGNYASVWNHPFFALLKTWHDTYGATFSLLMFTTIFGNITNAFASDLGAAADWLKFSLHGNDYSASGTADGAADWTAMVNAVITMTGNPNSIDRHTRLSSFTGSTANITAMRDCPLGVVCLSGSETEARLSYNFDANEQKFMYDYNVYYQGLTNLHFVRSYERFDSKVWNTTYATNIVNYVNGRDFSEFFIHEYSLFNSSYQIQSIAQTFITEFFKLVKKNGYIPTFWQIK